MRNLLILCLAAAIFTTACVPKSEHEKLQTQVNGQSAELEKERQTSKQIRHELDKSLAENKTLTADIQSVRIEIAKLKTELAQKTADLSKASGDLSAQLAKKPALPVKITFRSALLGGGQVLQIFNDASKSIPIRLLIKRPGTGTTKDFELVLRGNVISEFGPQEGWGFESGDIIDFKQNDYEALQTVCR